MTHRRPAAATLAALTVATGALAGCTGGPAPPEKEGANVDTVVESETRRQVEQRAGQIASLVGEDLKVIGVTSVPCTGKAGESSDASYWTGGTYQLFLPARQHAGTLARLREQWLRDGYTIGTYQTADDGRADKLEATAPDRFTVSVTSTTPPTALALSVTSPCRLSPTPLF
ncbi:MAG TPA: hypothetical protein VES42_16790 [Pilimelia sp.]|nr:hypothetical protein [Pilimelia sp.]